MIYKILKDFLIPNKPKFKKGETVSGLDKKMIETLIQRGLIEIIKNKKPKK